MEKLLEFLKQLKENNNREWFTANKDRFTALNEDMLRQGEKLIGLISAFDSDLAGLDIHQCSFRIYRDIRFSNDKTPYKTHVGLYFAKGGRKSPRAGYYLHLEPGNCLLSGGLWRPEPKLLKAVRQAIYDNIEEFTEIINKPAFKKLFPVIEGDMLKTMPKSFPKDFAYPDLLKYKDYVINTGKSEAFFNDPVWIEKVAADFKVMEPFNRFLNYTVDECLDLD